MKVIRTGATRFVILTRRYAIKIPRFDLGWERGLNGLLCNIQEIKFGCLQWHELCPVIFALWGGWLVVMPRAQPISQHAWHAFDYDMFFKARGLPIDFAEQKINSFGIYDGRIVAIDYGDYADPLI